MPTEIASSIEFFSKNILPMVALIFSSLSLYVAMRNWRESNRPIVTLEVRTHKAGNVSIIYDLVVLNSGTRPAVSIQLRADPCDLEQAMEAPLKLEESRPLVEGIKRCFSDETVIPLLIQGKETSNAFGRTGDKAVWRYKASFQVEIEYYDLGKKKYKAYQRLIIKSSDGFAGDHWS